MIHGVLALIVQSWPEYFSRLPIYIYIYIYICIYMGCGSSANALSPRDLNSAGGEEVGVVCGIPTLTLSALLLAQGIRDEENLN